MRIKRGFKARRRRKKVLKLAKGFRRRTEQAVYRTAADAVDKAHSCMPTATGKHANGISGNYGSPGSMPAPA
jgi:ribosomal protein L20